MNFVVRPFRAGDAAEIFRILEETEELHVGGLTYSEKAVRSWHVTRARDIILVAEVEGAIAGFVASKPNDPETGAAYIDCLAVKPRFRGKGLGKQLLNQCTTSLKQQGVSFIHTHVRPEFHRSVNFWEKNNFKGKQPLLWMYKEI